MALTRNIRREYALPDTIRRGLFRRDLEDPTQLGFKVEFGIVRGQSLHEDKLYTFPAFNNKLSGNMLYDDMPTPFFQLPVPTEAVRGSARVDNTLVPQGAYSAYTYLLNSNQDIRAEMLLDFIGGWHELQMNHPYLFESVQGINNLLNISTAYGPRIKEGYAGAKVTFTMRDTLDQRVRHMLSLYRSIVWDDEWHRHTMPDMSKFFKMYIYISDFRIFTKRKGTSLFGSNKITGAPDKKDVLDKLREFEVPKIPRVAGNGAGATATNILSRNLNNIARGVTERIKNKVEDKVGTATKALGLSGHLKTSAMNLVMEVVDSIAPVTLIECDMCDIDLPSLANIFASGYTDTQIKTSKTFNFTVNVRKVRVTHRFTATIENLDESYATEVFYKRFPTAEKYSYLGLGNVPSAISTLVDDKVISVNNTNLNQGSSNEDFIIAGRFLEGSSVVSDAIHLPDRDKEVNVLYPYHDTDVPSTHNRQGTDAEAGSPLWGAVGRWTDKFGKWVEGNVSSRIENAVDRFTSAPSIGGRSISDYLEAVGSENIIGLLGLIQDSLKKQMEQYDASAESSKELFREVLNQISLKKPSDEAEEQIIEASKEVLSNMKLYQYMESYADKYFVDDIFGTEEDRAVQEANLYKSIDTDQLDKAIHLKQSEGREKQGEVKLTQTEDASKLHNPTLHGTEDSSKLVEPNLLKTTDKGKVRKLYLHGTEDKGKPTDVNIHGTEDSSKLRRPDIFGDKETEELRKIQLEGSEERPALEEVVLHGDEEREPLANPTLHRTTQNEPTPNIELHSIADTAEVAKPTFHGGHANPDELARPNLYKTEGVAKPQEVNLHKGDDRQTPLVKPILHGDTSREELAPVHLKGTEDRAKTPHVSLYASKETAKTPNVSMFSSICSYRTPTPHFHHVNDGSEREYESVLSRQPEQDLLDEPTQMEKVKKEHSY
nr:MAG TPA: hypothetical protein [Caudoviricetes sp.]